MCVCLQPPSKSKTGITTLESDCGRLIVAHVDSKGKDIAMRWGKLPPVGIDMSSFEIESASPQAGPGMCWDARISSMSFACSPSLIHHLSRIVVTALF